MNPTIRPDETRPAPRRALSRAVAALAAPLAAFLLAADAGHAQSSWNRRLEAVAVTESGAAGQHDIHVVLELHGDGETTIPQDLSTEIEVRINRSVVATHTVPVGLDPGAGAGCVDAAACGGSCGTGSIDGFPHALLCLADGECSPGCDCKCKFPPITWTVPAPALATGDEIMVLLRPAPGALPDGDSSDDQIEYTFSAPVFWDRTLTDVSIVPVPTAMPDSFFDIWVDVTAYHEGLASFLPAGAAADLGMEIDLLVNGAPYGSTPLPFRPVPIAPACDCASACATWDGSTHTCRPYLGTSDCMCGWPWLSILPAVPLEPGDEITVILRPAPGALPELPGFPDDEDGEECCPGPTGVESFTTTVSTLLEPNRPNPFRAGTTVAFRTRATSPVTVELFDVQGRRVRTLVDGRALPAGSHAVEWDGLTRAGDVAPDGVYFCRLTADGRTESRKMTRTR